MTLSDFDTDFLKYVEEFIFENITCFIASGQFAPVPSSLDEENCSLVIEDKMQDLYVKLPGKSLEPTVSLKLPFRMADESNEPTNMKMPPRTVEGPVEPLMVKMVSLPLEKSINFTSQCGIVTQQNFPSYGNFVNHEPVELDTLSPEQEFDTGNLSPGSNLEQVSPLLDPFELRCDPEAEIEPEVEIGTEADLAEADQSPGQQGTMGDVLPSQENWSLDHEAVLIHRSTNNSGAIVIMNEDDGRGIEDLSEGASGVQPCSDSCLDQDAVLDDIPTKLYPSEEELPQQVKDAVQLPSDDTSSHGEFVSENNIDAGPANLR